MEKTALEGVKVVDFRVDKGNVPRVTAAHIDIFLVSAAGYIEIRIKETHILVLVAVVKLQGPVACIAGVFPAINNGP